MLAVVATLAGPPRVVHVLEALETGCARHVVDLVAHVPGVEHHVVVPRARVGGVTDTAAVGRIEAARGHVHVVEMRRSPLDRRNGAALFALRRLLAEVMPGVIHGHSSIGGALARTAAVGRPLACVYTPHGLAAGRWPSAVERVLGRRTDRLVAVSPSERDEVLRRRLVPADRVVVIPNGIDVDPPPPADLRALAGIPDDGPLVATMGRLARQKAPEVFVAACAAVAAARPDARFVHIGDGPLADEVAAAVAAAGIGDRYHRLPVVPDAARYLPTLAAFVLTSRFEGGPYAPLEAMRAGVPVVVTDVVGARDCVDDGRTGLVVAPDDPAATAAAVLRVLDDAGLAARLATAAGDALRARFDVVTMGGAHAELYHRLAAERPVAPG